nr:hypothetical protein [uncultured Gellertiella sp.]
MKQLIGTLACICWILLAVFPVSAADQAPPPNPDAETIDTLKQRVEMDKSIIENLSGQIDQFKQAKMEKEFLQREKAITEASIATYEDETSAHRHNITIRAITERIYAWQIWAGDWVLFIVILISLSGVGFAGYEMVSGRRMVEKAMAERLFTPAGEPITLSLEPNKIQIRSAVIGVVILTLSMGYLYLFLREVYSLHAPTPAGAVATTVAAMPAQSDK